MKRFEVTFKPGTGGGAPNSKRAVETVEAVTWEEQGRMLVFFDEEKTSGAGYGTKVLAVPSADVEAVKTVAG